MNLRNRMNRNRVQDYSYRSAARYNKRNDEIFASYEKYLQKEMEWLRRQGVSEDEIQNAYRHTGLGSSGLAKLIQQVALENGDNRELSEILGEAHSISDSRRVKDGSQYDDVESQEEYDYCKQTAKEIDNWLEYENGVPYNEVCAELESRGFVLSDRHGRGDTEQIWQVENNITTAGLYLSVVKGGTIAKYCDFTSNINKFDEDEWKMYSL